MKKSAQVVMLPTNEKANIVLKKNNELLILPTGHIGTNPSKLTQPQHLYFLSDEEIKEGDYVIEDIGGVVYGPIDRESIVENPKKIIATTDRSLNAFIESKDGNYTEHGQGYFKELPQPPQSFIEKFVEEYNKGNVITDVMVEYEWNKTGRKIRELDVFDHILKINPDNTITIRKVKDSWSRDEVKHLLECVWNEGAFWGSSKPNSHYFDKWIEENL